MIRLIAFLVIAVGLSWLGAWLADNPGQVSLTWQGLQVETSFAVFVVGVLLLSVLLALAFEVVRLLRGAPKTVHSPPPSPADGAGLRGALAGFGGRRCR